MNECRREAWCTMRMDTLLVSRLSFTTYDWSFGDVESEGLFFAL
jgi:hypothetical protein